jgi:hypothetical protein
MQKNKHKNKNKNGVPTHIQYTKEDQISSVG